MTQIPLRHYSGEMVSEFHQLSEKIAQLAELTQSLRRENAELRLSLASLTAENAELASRMDEASRRITALLDMIPASGAPVPSEQNEEVA